MNDHDEIRELKRQIADLRRIVESLPVREAQTMQRGPFYIGVLDEDLTFEGSADVILWRQKPDGTFESTGKTVKGWDWLLEEDWKLEDGNRVGLVREKHSKLWLVLFSNKCRVPDPPA